MLIRLRGVEIQEGREVCIHTQIKHAMHPHRLSLHQLKEFLAFALLFGLCGKGAPLYHNPPPPYLSSTFVQVSLYLKPYVDVWR